MRYWIVFSAYLMHSFHPYNAPITQILLCFPLDKQNLKGNKVRRENHTPARKTGGFPSLFAWILLFTLNSISYPIS